MTITPAKIDLPCCVSFDFQHEFDFEKIVEIAELMNSGEDFDPILVISDDSTNMYSILDGHHRARAAQLSRREIPAYVISGSQYEALVKAEFGGEYPEQIMDLDQYIVLPDGQSYSDVRDVD